MFLISLDKYPEVELLDHIVVNNLLFVVFFDNGHSDRCEGDRKSVV